MTTLAHERGPEDALARQIRFKRELGVMLDVASSQRRGNRAAVDDGSLRQKLATSVIEIELMRLNCLRSFSKMIQGKQLGPESSFQKLYWSHVAQRMYETGMETLGPTAPLAAGDPAPSRSIPGPRKFSGTSSPNACSDCRNRHELRFQH